MGVGTGLMSRHTKGRPIGQSLTMSRNKLALREAVSPGSQGPLMILGKHRVKSTINALAHLGNDANIPFILKDLV